MHLKELDANLLVVLDALLTDASVTKAAERLGRSPSAVSHALANLRELFHDELFVRAGQRLVPTAKATELAPTIHVIVTGIEGLLRPGTPFEPQSQQRNLVLACREPYELTLLHELRRVIKEIAPGVTLTWKALNGEASFEDLRLGRVQYLIREGAPGEDAADFIWHHLFDETYVTLGRQGHAFRDRKITSNEFEDCEHILIAPGEGAADPVSRHFAHHGVSISDATRASSLFVGLFLAHDSEALVTVPSSVAEAAGHGMALSQIRQPFPPLVVQNYLCWHRSQDRDECHQWLREQLIALVRPQPTVQ